MGNRLMVLGVLLVLSPLASAEDVIGEVLQDYITAYNKMTHASILEATITIDTDPEDTRDGHRRIYSREIYGPQGGYSLYSRWSDAAPDDSTEELRNWLRYAKLQGWRLLAGTPVRNQARIDPATQRDPIPYRVDLGWQSRGNSPTILRTLSLGLGHPDHVMQNRKAIVLQLPYTDEELRLQFRSAGAGLTGEVVFFRQDNLWKPKQVTAYSFGQKPAHIGHFLYEDGVLVAIEKTHYTYEIRYIWNQILAWFRIYHWTQVPVMHLKARVSRTPYEGDSPRTLAEEVATLPQSCVIHLTKEIGPKARENAEQYTPQELIGLLPDLVPSATPTGNASP